MNWKQKVEILLLIGLIVLCSGCSQKMPLIQEISPCFPPIKPVLPVFVYENLESETNIKNLLFRDDIYRQYIVGLEDTLTCYENQIKGK